MPELSLPSDVTKEVVCEGDTEGVFTDKAKVIFDYTISTVNGQKLDSSSDPHCGPFELILGKEFLLPAWEQCLRTMKIGERAKFTLPSKYCENYTRVGKALRDEAKIQHDKSHGIEAEPTMHNCAAAGDHERYADLYEAHGTDLVCDFTLKDTRAFGQYERAHWELSLKEKWDMVPVLRAEGNELFKQGQWEAASDKYRTALGYLEMVASPGTSDGSFREEDVTALQVPCLLNFSAALLKLERYPEVVTHCSTALEKSRDNPKALYRRARAYMLSGHLDSAREDLNTLEKVDPTNDGVESTRKQLARIAAVSRKKEKDMYQGMFNQE